MKYIIVGCFMLFSFLSINIFGHNGVEVVSFESKVESSSNILTDCTATDYNIVANKQSITMSTTMTIGGGSYAGFTNGVGGGEQGIWWQRNHNVVGQEVLKMVFPSETVLVGFEVTGGFFLDNNVTYQIEGSNDGSTWVDITGVQTFSSTATAPAYGASDNSYKFPVEGNTTAYAQYRIYGVTGQTDWNWVSEIYLATIPVEQSGLTNLDCDDSGTITDTADDFIKFDLNPQGGTGSYTVAAAGTTVTPSTGTFGTTTSFELPTGSAGAGDVTLTITGFDSGCEVTQVLEDPGFCLPGPCGVPDWNDPALKATLTGSYDIPGSGCVCGVLTSLVDSNNSSGPGTKNNSYTNHETFIVNFPEPTVLKGMEVVVEGVPMTAATLRVEGSNDGGANYTAVSIDYILGTNLSIGVAQYGTGSQAYTFPFADNETAYSTYRLYAVNMSTSFGKSFDELYFDYDFFDLQLTNQGCDDNGTFSDYTDDKLTFDINPIPGTPGDTYVVSVDGGFTITPTSGTYGSATSFTVSSGSSGSGDLSLSLIDASVPCGQTTVIPNSENACIPGPCGGPDWNDSALKATLTGSYDIPGLGCVCGVLTSLVDSNNSSGPGTKNNSYTNHETFIVNFPEPAVLKGMEVVVEGVPMNAATLRVEGSNDGGANYTAVSIDYILGTNLSIGAAQYGTGAQAYTFPFADNETAYTTYRLFAVSMNTSFGKSFDELYFDYDVFDAGVDNISFGDNGTPGVFEDDVIDFELNPSPGTGTYSVQFVGDYTVTPSTGTYGEVTNFQISSGSAGTGDLTLLLIDETVPCVQEFILPNPDLSAEVVTSQAACASPTDSPLGSITITAEDGVYTKAEYNMGTAYAGTGYATATDITDASAGFEIVNDLVNPEMTTYYTVRAYVTETLYRDFVVSLDKKVCAIAQLEVTIAAVDGNSGFAGETIEYLVTVTNAGPDPGVNVEVRVDIPSNTDYVASLASNGNYNAMSEIWFMEEMPVGSETMTITYKLK